MSHNQKPKMNSDAPIVYQIRLKGHLGLQWMEWFEGVTISQDEDGNTLLIATVLDQAALYGLLRKVRDLNLQLISLTRVEAD